jgi:hypothetical protein
MVGCAGNFQEEPYMKRTFLISTATAALVAGTVLAAAQGAQKQAPASGAMDRGGAAQSETQRGSDHMQNEDRKGREEGRKGERRGQAQGEKREPKTTGQSQGQEQRQQSQQGQKGDQSPPRASERGQSKEQSKQQQTQGERKEGAKDQRREGQNERREGQSERREGQNDRREGQGERREGARQESGKSSVSFTTEQRTKIRETVLRGSNAPRVSKVDFSVRVGTVVPSSVHVVTVPDVIVEVHPEWRGFYYFVYNEEIVILDRDHHIVAIVEV